MIKVIISSFKDGSFFKRLFNKIELFFIGIIRFLFEKRITIKENRILFFTFQGNYNCNPKAIAEEIISNKLPYELIWVVNKENYKALHEYPKELCLVKKNSWKFYKYAASSKIIIDNANNFEYSKLKKKKGQYLIQTWHGSMGFKRLDSSSVKNSLWVKKALLLDKITDYCIVNSDFEIDVFRNGYWPSTKMLKYGHPRNDILFNKNNEFKKYNKKIRDLYKIDKDTKIILYAPTFRDILDFNAYNLDYDNLIKSFEERFGGKWCVLVRFHFKLKYTKIPQKFIKKVINVTDYPDMQELLCACDAGITDYSSWMCDFVLTRRPGFLFTLDIEKYIDERGFYYPLDSSPFPVCKTNKELQNSVLNFNQKEYEKKVNEFLKDKGCFERGIASKKTVEKINELLR